MQKQPALISLEAMTGRAIRFQVTFVILDLIFRLTARTVNLLVEHLSAGVLHVRHDKAGVDALGGHLDLDHHAARARPRPSLVPCRVEARDLAPIALIGPFGLLNYLPSQLRQDAMAGQTGHISEGSSLLDPLHHLGVGKGAIAAKDEQGVGPGLAKALDQARQYREPLGTSEAFRLEDRGDQTP